MKRCAECGRAFPRGAMSHPVYARTRYCSRACAAARRLLPEKPCENPRCRKPYRPKKWTQRYCSPTCVHQAAAGAVPAAARRCVQCGTSFARRANEAVQDFVKRRFCSFGCGQAGKMRPVTKPTVRRCQLGDCAWVLTTPGATRCTPGDGSPVCLRRQTEAA